MDAVDGLSISESQSVSDRTLQAMVCARIRREILEGTLAPGSRVKHVEVAARLDVSTTPVREALRELRTQGLLSGDAHRGMTVYKPNKDDLEEIYRIRLLLEPECARRAALYMGPLEVQVGRGVIEKMETVTDPVQWAGLNRVFHTVIDSCARSPRLASILDGLRALSELYVTRSLVEQPLRFEDSRREHRELLEACAKGDGDRAASTMATHLGSTVGLVQRAFDGSTSG